MCAEDPTHHLSVGKLVMVRHENVHRIEWPLGVITTVYPDASGVIRTAEVEECGKRSHRPISYLVPLELDCRHDVYAHANDRGMLKKKTPTTTKKMTPALMTTSLS